MKTVFNNAELSHVWANQSQTHGRGSSMFMEYERIYSFSTCIAEIVNDGFIVNDYCYSSYTSRHQSHVRRAIPSNSKIIYISGFGRRGTNSLKLNQYDFNNTLVKNNHYQVEALLVKASRARLHGDSYRAQAYNIIQSLVKYAKFLDLKYDNLDLDQFAQLAIENAKQAAILEKNKKAALIEKQAENLQKWRNGENVNTLFEITALRVKGETIETSRGANIPLDQAIKLWPLVSSLHANGKEYTRGNSLITLGGYKLLSFKNDVLTVGCHEIPYSELETIATQL